MIAAVIIVAHVIVTLKRGRHASHFIVGSAAVQKVAAIRGVQRLVCHGDDADLSPLMLATGRPGGRRGAG
jgi:hypothetical protein